MRKTIIVGMQIGLFGKANVGKSTFFSAATEDFSAQIGDFPFTTIQPNVGIAYVSTTCACKHFKINHNNPLPSCAPGTRPATSMSLMGMNLIPDMHKGLL